MKNENSKKQFSLEMEIVKSTDLKKDDIMIHNYSLFKINECGCGSGSGNEFGDYFWIKGHYVNGFSTGEESFWSFQGCPVIRVIV